jgi:hypothetical protein
MARKWRVGWFPGLGRLGVAENQFRILSSLPMSKSGAAVSFFKQSTGCSQKISAKNL